MKIATYLFNDLFQMEVELKMRVTPTFEEISANVKYLQIASAKFNKRDKRRAKVCIYYA